MDNSLAINLHSPVTRTFDKWYYELFTSDNFVAIPSIGSLVEGWLLVMPRQYYLSMGSLNTEALLELNAFVDRIKAAIEPLYGAVTLFEHGPANLSQPVGCSVDYAHLHIVPVKFSVLARARVALPRVQWQATDGFNSCVDWRVKGKEYLYISDPYEGTFTASFHNIPSQFFRKMIAEGLGIEERFNWRRYEEAHNIKATINKLSAIRKPEGLRSYLLGAAYKTKAVEPNLTFS